MCYHYGILIGAEFIKFVGQFVLIDFSVGIERSKQDEFKRDKIQSVKVVSERSYLICT